MQVAHFQNFFDAVRAGKQQLLHADVNEIYLSTAFDLLGNISSAGEEVDFRPRGGTVYRRYGRRDVEVRTPQSVQTARHGAAKDADQ